MGQSDYEPMTEDQIIALSDRILAAGVKSIDGLLGEGSAKVLPILLAKYLEVTLGAVHNELLNASIQDANAAGGFDVMPPYEDEN